MEKSVADFSSLPPVLEAARELLRIRGLGGLYRGLGMLGVRV